MKTWMPDMKAGRGPRYLAISNALEEAVRGEAFNTGDTLSSQRMLADFRDLHVNTINRGMRECAPRGLTREPNAVGTMISFKCARYGIKIDPACRLGKRQFYLTARLKVVTSFPA
jgi:DNA-binding transcriptional regulator YhcF (GntR family)